MTVLPFFQCCPLYPLIKSAKCRTAVDLKIDPVLLLPLQSKKVGMVEVPSEYKSHLLLGIGWSCKIPSILC